MPIGVCAHCGLDYYLGGVEAVEDHCCAQCGRPLVSVDTFMHPTPTDSPPGPEFGSEKGDNPSERGV
ncbi:MAG: hypothetical protein L0Z62_47685 [Gemmataceae bacterium]|nr:hypothetical protein [Gemmataceae bacterium]